MVGGSTLGPMIISIHAPREGGDDSTYRVGITQDYISIHAPREGGDRCRTQIHSEGLKISIHAPREGGDYRVGG